MVCIDYSLYCEVSSIFLVHVRLMDFTLGHVVVSGRQPLQNALKFYDHDLSRNISRYGHTASIRIVHNRLQDQRVCHSHTTLHPPIWAANF